jgi:hypothetical protein
VSKFDFNKPTDFAIATMSASTELLNAFARDQTRWEITEGSYKGGRKTSRNVLFHVFKSKTDGYQAGLPRISDTGGRRTAKLASPYRDGQTTDDLGARGEDFDLEIILHGVTYKAAMNRLLREFNDPIPGTLYHPVRGALRCKATDWNLTHEAVTKQAVMIRVQFTEHNYDTAIFVDRSVAIPSTKNALQQALSALRAIGAAIAALRALVNFVQSSVTAIRQKLQEFYTAYQNLIADAASAFGLTGADVSAALSINQGGNLAPNAGGRTAGGVNPDADPGQFGADASLSASAGAGGISTSTGGFVLVSERFTTVVAPADPFANLPIGLLGDVARAAIEQNQLQRLSDVMRQMADEILDDLDAAIEATKASALAAIGRAAATVVTLTDTKIAVLEACAANASLLRSGSANGRPQIINYEVPRAMSIREAAFLNGLTAQDGADISILNPTLDSVNEIDADTILLVPTFS